MQAHGMLLLLLTSRRINRMYIITQHLLEAAMCDTSGGALIWGSSCRRAGLNQREAS